MPMWRCPHCGTPQAEAARCWVCRRSSTSCATCRDFRHSVAGERGYCGRDRGRSALAGDEIRPCWEARTAVIANAVVVASGPTPAGSGRTMPVIEPVAAERPFGDLELISLTDTSGRLWVDAD